MEVMWVIMLSRALPNKSQAQWSSRMIVASGFIPCSQNRCLNVTGPGFKSRLSPYFFVFFFGCMSIHEPSFCQSDL